MVLLTLGIVAAIFLLIHWLIMKPFTYWKKRNIQEYVKSNPYVDLFNMYFNRRSFVEVIHEQYLGIPHKKCYGVYLFRTPQLIIRDSELIKQITVKDFDYFTDHVDTFLREDIDELWGKNLFAMKGKRWHNLRTTLSPAFTGAKMRGMFELMLQCGEQVATHYQSEIDKQNSNKPYEIEFKEMCSRYTNDIIATTAFGIKIDSFKDPNNEFFTLGRKIMNFSLLRFILVPTFPKLCKFLGIQLMPKRIYTFFHSIIRETLEARTKQNIIRPDMIHLLLEARNQILLAQKQNDDEPNNRLVLNDDEITAQAFIFFVAGFDTVAVAMSFASYELATKPDIQERVYAELKQALLENDGKITYEALSKMKYLDMVLSETLRKWSPAVVSDRQCVKPYTLNIDGQEIEIEPGMGVHIPVWGIHHDEKYFPNPEKFDPERFSDDNKKNIKPFTYMPFGNGPRICIASRFALMEVKVFLVSMLSQFRFDVIERTPIPIVFRKKASNLDPEGGMWLGLVPRH